ncbi:penicillin-binding protein [Pseudalkalibacillus sp. SCS-8]|uniref:penicillin-binding protein n=1 Tax=Pseudalkalibacillus nanhaiensis TaxID=3115291 RepID=UPI0032D9DA33
MSLFDNECGCNKKKRASKCDGCICDQLRKLRPGTKVDAIVSGETEDTDNLIFSCLDEETCCATFIQDYGNRDVVILDCRQIQGIRIHD